MPHKRKRPFWVFFAIENGRRYRFISFLEKDLPMFESTPDGMTEQDATRVNIEIVKLLNRWPWSLENIAPTKTPPQSGHGAPYQLLQTAIRALGGLN